MQERAHRGLLGWLLGWGCYAFEGAPIMCLAWVSGRHSGNMMARDLTHSHLCSQHRVAMQLSS